MRSARRERLTLTLMALIGLPLAWCIGWGLGEVQERRAAAARALTGERQMVMAPRPSPAARRVESSVPSDLELATPPRVPREAPAEARLPAPPLPRGEPGPPEPLATGERRLIIPVEGIERSELRDNYEEARGERQHGALDILAPRDTPVLAADDGEIEKLFLSDYGGLTVYQFDPTATYVYYYAHLERYAPGLTEGQRVRQGDIIGYVGTSGNARTPHLHFSIHRLEAEKRWWKGTPLDPYPILAEGRGLATAAP